MKSFTSLMPALHAMRSAELAQYLDKASGGLKQNPESLKAYFNGLGSITGSMSSGINATRYTAPKSGNQPAQGGAKEGDSKTNSAGDKVVFKAGKWGPG
jgi:hypothetical protein